MTLKYINIFISSTFMDMQSERDCIKKMVLPRLALALLPYGIVINVTDLRWGVDTTTENEEEREAKVLHVCLDTIKRNRPYFIGLIGDRYGWIPPKQKLQRVYQTLPQAEREILPCDYNYSVTELEMIFGALGSLEIIPHSFFFFRTPDSYNHIPAEYRDTYCDKNTTSKQKLEKLKNNIIGRCHKCGIDDKIFPYNSTWDSKACKLGGLNEFCDTLYSALFEDILKYDVSELQKLQDNPEQMAFDAFVTHKLSGFCGRKTIVTKLEKFLLDYNPLKVNGVNGKFLIGTSGSGKSSIFCKVYDNLIKIQEEHKLIVLAHSAGITAESRNPKVILNRWIALITEKINDTSVVDHSEHDDGNLKIFKNLLITAISKGYKPIVLLDSYDSIAFPTYGVELYALKNLSFIPKVVPFICTTLPNYCNEIIDSDSSYESIQLDLFSRSEAMELIDNTLALSVKELSSKLINILLSKTRNDEQPSYSSPLWLRMCLSMLDEIGNDDFREINKQKFDRADEKIVAYLERLLNDFSPEPETLVKQYIELSCKFFNPKLVRTTMLFSAISNYGLSEVELEELCQDCWDELEFANFSGWMRKFLIKDSFTGRWSLSHNILKNEIAKSDNISNSNSRENYIKILLKRFNAGESGAAFKELIYQVLEQLDIELFFWIQENNKYGLTPGVILEEYISNHNEHTLCDFVSKAATDYFASEDFYSIIYLISDVSEIDNHELKIELLNVTLENIDPKLITNGDKNILENYFRLVNEKYRSLIYHEEYDDFDRAYEDFYKIYDYNKHQFGINVFSSASIDFIAAILFDHAKAPSHRYFAWENISEEMHQKFANEAVQRWQHVLEQLQWLFQKRDLEKYADQYSISFSDRFFSKEQIDLLHSAVDSANLGVFLMTPQINNNNNFDDYLNDYLESIDNCRDDEKSSDSSQENMIRNLEAYISKNINLDKDDDYNTLSGLYIELSDLLIKKGARDEALQYMQTCAGLTINYYVRIPEIYKSATPSDSMSYYVRLRFFNPLVAIAEWYVVNDCVDCAIEILEKSYQASLLWLALIPKNEAVYANLTKLLNFYINTCCYDKALSLYATYYEFITRYPLPLENKWDSDVNRYVNLIRESNAITDINEIRNRANNCPNQLCIESTNVGKYQIMRSLGDDYSAVAIPGKSRHCKIWGFVDSNGVERIKPQYDDASCFVEGLAIVGRGVGGFGYVGMKYGYIDKSNRKVTPIIYDYASAFYNGEALVCIGNNFYYIDKNGDKTRSL